MVVDGIFEADDQRIGLLRHIQADDHFKYAGQFQRLGAVNRNDLGVGVGRAQEGSVQSAFLGRDIVDELPLSLQQSAVLDPQHPSADMFVARRRLFGYRKIRHQKPFGFVVFPDEEFRRLVELKGRPLFEPISLSALWIASISGFVNAGR